LSWWIISRTGSGLVGTNRAIISTVLAPAEVNAALARR
jgi:hypothetical protein